MPCNSIQRNTVEWNKVNLETLEKALKAEGFEVLRQGEAAVVFRKPGQNWLTYSAGQVTYPAELEATVTAAKQAYGGYVVKQTAAKFGWTVKKTADNKFQMIKR